MITGQRTKLEVMQIVKVVNEEKPAKETEKGQPMRLRKKNKNKGKHGISEYKRRMCFK